MFLSTIASWFKPIQHPIFANERPEPREYRPTVLKDFDFVIQDGLTHKLHFVKADSLQEAFRISKVNQFHCVGIYPAAEYNAERQSMLSEKGWTNAETKETI